MKKFLKSYRELLTALWAVVFLIVFNIIIFPLIRMTGYPIGDIDMVTLIRPVQLLLNIFILHAGLWLLWKITWGFVQKYFDTCESTVLDFVTEFKTLTPWQRILTVSLLWSAYLVFFGLVAVSGIM